MEETSPKGLLSVAVKAPAVIADRPVTISLVIQNPFDETVTIESIQAPSSSLLAHNPEASSPGASTPKSEASGIWSFFSSLRKFRIEEVTLGPLVARFPEEEGRSIAVDMKPNSKLTIRQTLGPRDRLSISNAEGAEVILDIPPDEPAVDSPPTSNQRVIPPHQEDIASFELRTAHWLMVKPESFELYALIRYKVGNDLRSQVIPVNLTVQPPVKAIVIGGVSGGVLGFLARQLNAGPILQIDNLGGAMLGLLGIVVMTTIAAMVLSRREASKGFITLEDFYGAFVVGVLIGYFGTEYFEEILSSRDPGKQPKT